MTEYMEKEAFIANLNRFAPGEYSRAVDLIIQKQPAADVVARSAYDQVCWERDIAMKQLEDYGIPFGGKPEAASMANGQWEESEDGDGVVCPECREDFCVLLNETDRFKHCPNCGKQIVIGIASKKAVGTSKSE